MKRIKLFSCKKEERIKRIKNHQGKEPERRTY